jgi:hypothetical protein
MTTSTHKKDDYKSRKFILTTCSLVVFTVLLAARLLTGDQFVTIYWSVLATYMTGNVIAAITAPKGKGDKDDDAKSKTE